MTREELIATLLRLGSNEPYPEGITHSDGSYSPPNQWDLETTHTDADEALIAFIDDPEVRAAFEAIDKWYA